MKKILILIFVVTSLFSFNFSFAQDSRSYLINSFDATLTVNKDSTVDVVEKITYGFNGVYHRGLRSISHKDIGAITDLYVVDVRTGQRLSYSPVVLDKTDPANWNKYTFYNENGNTNVQWYYSVPEGVGIWEIHYKVHGLIGFYNNYDEVYWNLFTEYEVPVSHITGTVILPEGAVYKQREFYRKYFSYKPGDNKGYAFEKIGNNIYRFTAENAEPHEDLTLALGFEKGVVLQNDYWKDLAKLNWGIGSGLFFILLTVIFLLIRYLIKERGPKYSKSIIAEYEPPQKLRPAEMDLIYREGFSKKTWAATIIDLAVRGYVKIEEEPVSKALRVGMVIIKLFVIAIFIFAIVATFSNRSYLWIVFIPILIVLLAIFSKERKDYKVISLKDSLNDDNLKSYEKSFMTAIFNGNIVNGYLTFSTKAMRSDPGASMCLYEDMKRIEESFLDDISCRYPGLYDKVISLKKIRKILRGVIIVFLIGTVFVIAMSKEAGILQEVAVLVSIIFIILLCLYFIKYNPKLSSKGNDLWRDIDGFRMFLHSAERYRLQNLTPELFEKFLPYAMIFGIEKKWAKNFEGIIKHNPDWYSSGVYVGGTSGILSGESFSISGFSTSFSSSFSSAFSASGGGGDGGSGGGGDGGGGGGGGGGGAD